MGMPTYRMFMGGERELLLREQPQRHSIAVRKTFTGSMLTPLIRFDSIGVRREARLRPTAAGISDR
jgi:hypothetical protein